MGKAKGGAVRRPDLQGAGEAGVASNTAKEGRLGRAAIREYARSAVFCVAMASIVPAPAGAQDVPVGQITPTRDEVERAPPAQTVETAPRLTVRLEERRVGKGCGSACSARWSRRNLKRK